MALGVIEIFALIVVLLAAIKLIVILIKPQGWLNVIRAVYANKILTTIIALVLAGVVLKYLLNAGITIVEIFAVMLFFMLLMLIGVAAYAREVVDLAEDILSDKTVMKKSWLAILIWIVLIIWVLYSLFA